MAENISILCRAVQMAVGCLLIKNAMGIPQCLAPVLGRTVSEVEEFSDGAMKLPRGKDLFQVLVAIARIEHVVMAAVSLFGMGYTFTIPFHDAHPAFFINATAWTLAGFTHYKAFLAPSKYQYIIGWSKPLMVIDPIFALCGWFSFYASRNKL